MIASLANAIQIQVRPRLKLANESPISASPPNHRHCRLLRDPEEALTPTNHTLAWIDVKLPRRPKS
jgi:hypothetical protein